MVEKGKSFSRTPFGSALAAATVVLPLGLLVLAALALASSGPKLARDINPSGSSYPDYLTNVGGTLFFAADDGTHGNELWRSDGTGAGTRLVKDINPGRHSVD
jgi:ELWxxDGT repeat protein